jgi:hypothetical protein
MTSKLIVSDLIFCVLTGDRFMLLISGSEIVSSESDRVTNKSSGAAVGFEGPAI